MAAKDAAMGYQIMSINVDSLSLAAPLPARTLLLALGHVLRSGVPQPQRLLAPRGRSFLVRHSAYIDCRSPLLRASPDSEYPFAKEVSQNKMPNWARSEYRNHEYVRKMEDVLAVYEKPYNPAEPFVCLDEKPVSLHAEVRPTQPAHPGQPTKRDSPLRVPKSASINPR
jgi:hypothetical protein